MKGDHLHLHFHAQDGTRWDIDLHEDGTTLVIQKNHGDMISLTWDPVAYEIIGETPEDVPRAEITKAVRDAEETLAFIVALNMPRGGADA